MSNGHRYARLTDGVITETWDSPDPSITPASAFHPSIASLFIEVDDTAEAGWRQVGNGFEPPPPLDAAPTRRRVPKSVITARFVAAGKAAVALQALQSNAELFLKWFVSDKGDVFADDPDTVAFVTALGLDPNEILQPGPSGPSDLLG
jgi:hypothetical protein